MPDVLPILLDTDDLIAVDKPAGLAAIPGRGEDDSVFQRLARQLGLPDRGNTDPRLRLVHRLDKETSGVMLFAKNIATQRRVSHEFQNNRAEKEYLAIVVNAPRDDEGVIDAPIAHHPANRLKMAVVKNGKSAITAWRVERRFRGFAVVRCFPKTGKTHQIRVHLAHIGHPLAVDALYNPHAFVRRPARHSPPMSLRPSETPGPPPIGLFLSQVKRGYRAKRDGREERPLIGRLTLHAEKLAINNPDGSRIEIVAGLPKDFRATLNQLSKL